MRTVTMADTCRMPHRLQKPYIDASLGWVGFFMGGIAEVSFHVVTISYIFFCSVVNDKPLKKGNCNEFWVVLKLIVIALTIF